MADTKPQRSIRILPKTSTELDRYSGYTGEIMYDSTSNVLRLYDGRTSGGVKLSRLSLSDVKEASAALLTSATHSGITVNYQSAQGKLSITGFSGNYDDLTNKPELPSLAGYATESYVNSAVSGISLTGYATETYVNSAVSGISLTGYATESYVSSAVSSKAPTNSPTFTGTVGGITKAMVGLGNVTNESKATMFNNPTFTGTVTGVSASSLAAGATISSPTINNAVLKNARLTSSGAGSNLVIEGNVMINDTTYPLVANSSAYVTSLQYSELTSSVVLVVAPYGGKPALTLNMLRASDQVTIIINGVSTNCYVDTITVSNSYIYGEFTISFYSDTGLVAGATIESVTVPVRPSISGADFTVDARLNVNRVVQTVGIDEVAGGYTLGAYNADQTSTWYLRTAPAADFYMTIEFYYGALTKQTMDFTLIIPQGVTPRLPLSVSINNFFSPTIQWKGGVTPTGTANGTDVIVFKLIRIDLDYILLAELTGYKAV